MTDENASNEKYTKTQESLRKKSKKYLKKGLYSKWFIVTYVFKRKFNILWSKLN